MQDLVLGETQEMLVECLHQMPMVLWMSVSSQVTLARIHPGLDSSRKRDKQANIKQKLKQVPFNNTFCQPMCQGQLCDNPQCVLVPACLLLPISGGSLLHEVSYKLAPSPWQ